MEAPNEPQSRKPSPLWLFSTYSIHGNIPPRVMTKLSLHPIPRIVFRLFFSSLDPICRRWIDGWDQRLDYQRLLYWTDVEIGDWDRAESAGQENIILLGSLLKTGGSGARKNWKSYNNQLESVNKTHPLIYPHFLFLQVSLTINAARVEIKHVPLPPREGDYRRNYL